MILKRRLVHTNLNSLIYQTHELVFGSVMIYVFGHVLQVCFILMC